MPVRLGGMKAAVRILLVLAIAAAAKVSADAAELNLTHRYSHSYRFPHSYTLWRAGPQDCFLMPDVIVAVDALGPYCSSPRGHFRRIVRR
jgi:hypothetical protein